jgi:hypothetical protein
MTPSERRDFPWILLAFVAVIVIIIGGMFVS